MALTLMKMPVMLRDEKKAEKKSDFVNVYQPQRINLMLIKRVNN